MLLSPRHLSLRLRSFFSMLCCIHLVSTSSSLIHYLDFESNALLHLHLETSWLDPLVQSYHVLTPNQILLKYLFTRSCALGNLEMSYCYRSYSRNALYKRVCRCVRPSVRNAISQTPARRILRRVFGLVMMIGENRVII